MEIENVRKEIERLKKKGIAEDLKAAEIAIFERHIWSEEQDFDRVSERIAVSLKGLDVPVELQELLFSLYCRINSLSKVVLVSAVKDKLGIGDE